MTGERGPARYMCSELVTAEWSNAFGRGQETVVNLEEIWSTGAALSFEKPVRAGAAVRIALKDVVFDGTVKKCSADFIGFLVELEFADGQRWSRELCEPDHLFDPRTLIPKSELQEKNHRLLEDIAKNLPRHAD